MSWHDAPTIDERWRLFRESIEPDIRKHKLLEGNTNQHARGELTHGNEHIIRTTGNGEDDLTTEGSQDADPGRAES